MQNAPDNDLLEALSPDTREYYLNSLKAVTAAKVPNGSDRAFPVFAQLEKMFYDAGGQLTVGTDPTGNGGVVAGYSSWRAIELLVEADGFTGNNNCYLERH